MFFMKKSLSSRPEGEILGTPVLDLYKDRHIIFVHFFARTMTIRQDSRIGRALWYAHRVRVKDDPNHIFYMDSKNGRTSRAPEG